MAQRRTSKRVKRLLKEQATPQGVSYKTNQADSEKWFDILNTELFDGRLPRVAFQFKWLRVVWAYYEYFPRKPDEPRSIILNKAYPTQKLFVECLAHEMIHHWQYLELGWRNVDHGAEFEDWTRKAKRIGLRIGEEQSE